LSKTIEIRAATPADVELIFGTFFGRDAPTDRSRDDATIVVFAPTNLQ